MDTTPKLRRLVRKEEPTELDVILEIAKTSDILAVEEALEELVIRTKLYYTDEIEERIKKEKESIWI